jgi:hypothetical protein
MEDNESDHMRRKTTAECEASERTHLLLQASDILDQDCSGDLFSRLILKVLTSKLMTTAMV